MLFPASPHDLPKLTRVQKGFGEAEILARFQWLTNANASWYVWWAEQEPRGWAIIQWNGKPTVLSHPALSDLYVHPDWRNQGIGTKILLACEQKVRDLGYTMLGLAVNPDLNPRAYALYQRLGYHAISHYKYLDGVYNGVEDWVIDLEKRL
jgi:GNAT superfamily N-acetyltransferase